MDYFKALPAYLGGKRRLAPLIFAALDELVSRERWVCLRFLDPFLGGGSVSLAAKALGFDVYSNDLALRSSLIGTALIENSSIRLGTTDLVQLLRPPTMSHPRIAEERFSPSVFPGVQARLIDNALFNIQAISSPKRELLLLLLIKWMLRCQPMSMLRGTDARAAAEGDLDRISPRRLGRYLKARSLVSLEAFQRLSEDVNTGIFPGNGHAYQMDALEFLANVPGDIAYLDPPYAGTTSYEREYAVIDQLLEGTVRPASAYSGKQPPLAELVELASLAEVLLLSYYGLSAGDGKSIELLVARTHKVRRVIELPYRHLASIASAERNRRSREFLIVATRKL